MPNSPEYFDFDIDWCNGISTFLSLVRSLVVQLKRAIIWLEPFTSGAARFAMILGESMDDELVVHEDDIVAAKPMGLLFTNVEKPLKWALI